MDSLGNPPQDISDVYIAYVLSKKRDWSDNKFVTQFKSLDKLAADFKRGTKISSYKLALLGLFLLNKNQNQVAEEILAKLLER